MPTILDERPHLVLRRLDREDLHGLAEILPQALGGDVDSWFDEAACA